MRATVPSETATVARDSSRPVTEVDYTGRPADIAQIIEEMKRELYGPSIKDIVLLRSGAR